MSRIGPETTEAREGSRRGSLRPRTATVFLAAFIAGGTAAVAVNRFVDVARTRAEPTVEREPIFVSLRPLPAGSPVTVWDVALRDWPKAMVPAAAIRPDESGRWCRDDERVVARVAIREGQPVLRQQLVFGDAPPLAANGPAPDESSTEAAVPETEVAASAPPTADATAAGPSPDSTEPASSASAFASMPPTEPAPTRTWTQAVYPEPDPRVDPPVDPPVDPADSDAGGWPTVAEASAGGEAAMRFLVVPERIAILADTMSAPPPPRKEVPTAPVAAPPAVTAQGSHGPSAEKSAAKDSRPSRGSSSTPKPRPSARPERTNATASPSGSTTTERKPRPSQPGSAASTTPRVKVVPDEDYESQPENESLLKSVFPNVAAGLERLETEVRTRRERLGAFFGGKDEEPKVLPR